MTSTGVPRLQLDSLGGRATPRSSTSRQAALQRVFKGLDDDDDVARPAAASARADTSVAPSAANESMRSTFSAGPAITPRASRDEIERRRKVMFDSEDEDTPSQPRRLASKVRALPESACGPDAVARVPYCVVTSDALSLADAGESVPGARSCCGPRGSEPRQGACASAHAGSRVGRQGRRA